MLITKTECNYQVTECDLKFGEKITLDGQELVPVIRCKDCKYWQAKKWDNGIMYGKFCTLTHHDRKSSDFCSIGEAR